MIDFTNCKVNNYKFFNGSICISYNGEDYFLKKLLINEYISFKIISLIGLKCLDFNLGKYNNDICIVFKDFIKDYNFYRFAEIKNSQINISKGGYDTELDDVIKTIESQNIYDTKELKEFFYDMFIVDALIGNFDRHNGNWGFLINRVAKEISIAPIYDCASCLYPQIDDEKISLIINDEDEMNARVYSYPNSALKINDRKINYFDYITTLEDKDCNLALCRIVPKINLDKIYDIIDNTDFISDIRKEFYKKIITLRYEKILKFSYNKLKER